MHRFYWMVEGAIAGCSRPGADRGRGARDAAALDDDLGWLRERGIAAILSLTETPLADGALERHGLAGLHLPVDDFHAPSPEQLARALAFIDAHRAHGRPVAVHCLAGQGRTGTVLAAYLIRGGLDAEAAIAAVRAVCPGAIEAQAQSEALAVFARERAWVV